MAPNRDEESPIHEMRVLAERIEERQLCLFDDPGLTDGERAFADEWIANGRNATAAYLAVCKRGADGKPGVKPETAAKTGCEWLKRDRVRAYIRQRFGALADSARLTQEELIETSRKIVLAGTGEMPVRRTIVTKDGGDRTLMMFEPNLGAANQAVNFLGRVLGIEGEGGGAKVSVVNAPGGLSELLADATPEERAALRSLVERRAAQLAAAEGADDGR